MDYLITTPKEFAEEMRILADNDDIEMRHRTMDHLMTSVLRELGYGEGVKIFKEARKWYA